MGERPGNTYGPLSERAFVLVSRPEGRRKRSRRYFAVQITDRGTRREAGGDVQCPERARTRGPPAAVTPIASCVAVGHGPRARPSVPQLRARMSALVMAPSRKRVEDLRERREPLLAVPRNGVRAPWPS